MYWKIGSTAEARYLANTLTPKLWIGMPFIMTLALNYQVILFKDISVSFYFLQNDICKITDGITTPRELGYIA